MLHLLDPDDPEAPFPPVAQAETEPNGLLAVGGDLSPRRLLNAYASGVFPWFSEGQPPLWWSPDPRTVLFPRQVKISRSLHKTLRNRPFRVTLNQAFAEVMAGCAAPRQDDEGTWITDAMFDAYLALHRLGHAHSVEVWEEQRLAGGLYGVAVGRVFFGESMFSRARDASKVALVRFARFLDARGFRLIDCQVYNPHLISLGAEEIERAAFMRLLEAWCAESPELDAALAQPRELPS